MHSRWVCHLAWRQYNQGGAFLITKAEDHPIWSQGHAKLLRNLPNVQFTPVSTSKFGLVSFSSQTQQSGILTNVGEITHRIRTESDAITKQKSSFQTTHDDGKMLFSDVLKKLDQDGHVAWRGSFSTWRTYRGSSKQKRAELNTHRIAQGVTDWIQNEVLAELDISNHYHLETNYP